MQQYWGYGQDAGFEVDKPDTDFLLQEMGGQTYLPDLHLVLNKVG